MAANCGRVENRACPGRGEERLPQGDVECAGSAGGGGGHYGADSDQTAGVDPNRREQHESDAGSERDYFSATDQKN